MVVSIIYSAKQNGHSLFQEGQLWGKLGEGHLKLLWTGRSRMAFVLPYKPRNTHLGLEGVQNLLGPVATTCGALERGILGLVAVGSLFLRLRRARGGNESKSN